MSEIITVQDLEILKKHEIFEAEVITGKVGGLAIGAYLATATNPVTGQIQKTLPEVISNAQAEFDAQIINMGFTRIGTFAAGATLTNPRQTLLWETSAGGDGQEYGWSGAFPKVVPPASTPSSTGGIAVGAWMSRFDPELRIVVREALRRSYAADGHQMVDGSFEVGGTLLSASDVMIHESTGKAFSGAGPFPQIVPPGTNPTSGGFTDRSTWPVASMQEFNAGAFGLHQDNTGLQNCQALQKLSAAVMQAGSGRVVFPTGIYTLGAQIFAGATGKGYAYKAEDALYIHDIGQLELQFEGCKFVMASGLKYGSFDPVTGEVYNPPSMPFLNADYAAQTGRFFRVDKCKNVTITGVMEFDANDSTRILGGTFGDTGWQLAEYGMYIRENVRCVSTASIYLHKFMEDCAYFVGGQGDNSLLIVENLTAIKGGRNVVTWAGGDNCYFNNCVIGLQGQGDSAISSAPASAIDVETEISPGKNLNFNDCLFLSSTNGVLGSGHSLKGARFNRCNFYADRDGDVTLYWNVRGTDFTDCNFYGPALTVALASSANQLLKNSTYTGCYFSNARSDGTIRRARNGRGVLIDTADAVTIGGVVYRNEFKDCKFNALLDGTSTAQTALTVAGAIVKDCELTIGGTLPDAPVSTLAANFGNVIIDGLTVTNNIVREFTDANQTMYIGMQIISETIAFAPKRCYMSVKKNSSNLQTLVWNSATQGAGAALAGRWVPLTRPRFNELDCTAGLALKRAAGAFQAERGVGPLYISAETTIPTTYDWNKGDVILNSTSGAGTAFGWVCTTAGTAGTTAVFKLITNIGA